MTAVINGGPNCSCPIMRRNTGCNIGPFYVNRHCESCATQGSVLAHHGSKSELVQPFTSHREANQAFSVCCHEINGFGCYHICGHCQVPFVLAIFIVNHDDHSSCSQFAESRCYARKFKTLFEWTSVC